MRFAFKEQPQAYLFPEGLDGRAIEFDESRVEDQSATATEHSATFVRLYGCFSLL